MTKHDYARASYRCIHFGACTCVLALMVSLIESAWGDDARSVGISAGVLALVGLASFAGAVIIPDHKYYSVESRD
jgi:hypothetical protein